MTYKNDYSEEITNISLKCHYKIFLCLPNGIKRNLFMILITLVLLQWYSFMLQTNYAFRLGN